MAKDPAVLWYWSDWRGGTGTFTRHLKGCYMDLLDAQFNSGPLSIDEIRIVLGADFGQAWPALQKKFTVTNTGLFYNKRMEDEKEKRKKFTESRRKNLLSPKKNQHMDLHMGPHTGDRMENEDENREVKGGTGEKGGKPEPVGIARVKEVARDVWESREWCESVCIGHGLTLEALMKWMAQYNSSICNDVIHGFDKSKYQKMFGGWLNTQKGKGYNLNNSLPKESSAPPLKTIG